MSRSAPRSEEELYRVIESVMEEWKPFDQVQASYSPSFESRDKIAASRSFYRSAVAEMVPSFEGSVGCDLGCRLGFGTLILSSLGAGRMYGIEIRQEFVDIAESWRSTRAVENLRFMTMRPGAIPLQSATVDWVVINQVLCNAYPDSFSASLAEAYRILRPSGVLVLCDSNNPHCPETMQRLEKTYRELEIGDGSPEEPCGTNYRRRVAIISQMDPALSREDVACLAKNTCYMWGDAIRKAVRNFRLRGDEPDSPFDPDSDSIVCWPFSGAANGNVTDPYAICRDMEALGLISHITVTPTWNRASNDTLYDQLRGSQGFYVYGVKPGSSASATDRLSSWFAGLRARFRSQDS